MLPFPTTLAFAIALATSRSIWNIKPLNFSTDHLPLESVSRSKTPVVVTLWLKKHHEAYHLQSKSLNYFTIDPTQESLVKGWIYINLVFHQDHECVTCLRSSITP